MPKNNYPITPIEKIARAGLIAAIYAVLVNLLPFISFFALQVRVAEALTVLAYIDATAILGLYVGALIANLSSPFGPIDIFFGSFLTLVAAVLTYLIGVYFKKNTSYKTYRYIGPLFALLPVVLVNAFGVAYILKIAAKLPYFASALSVGIGQFIAAYILGYPFLQAVIKSAFFTHKDKV